MKRKPRQPKPTVKWWRSERQMFAELNPPPHWATMVDARGRMIRNL